jgi:hypothetical protein
MGQRVRVHWTGCTRCLWAGWIFGFKRNEFLDLFKYFKKINNLLKFALNLLKQILLDSL